jgi:hypothetical protein
VRSWIVAAVVLISCGAAVSGQSRLVFDPFEERSHLVSSRVLATNYSIRLDAFQQMAEAAKKKFGEKAKTSLRSDTGQVVTTVDGKVVETSFMRARVADVFGIFLVGSRHNDMARFPFSFGISGKRDHPRDVGKMVRARFGKQMPKLFNFNDLEWTNLWCWPQDPPDAGAHFKDAQPRLGKISLCLVRWRRGEAKTMLIGALAADGGDWVRDASRPICRLLAVQWLQSPERSVQDNAIDYVGCLLVHDPDRGQRGARETVVDVLYEVRPDRSLVLIN